MSQIADTIKAVRLTADRVGFAKLALEAGVPLTTVRSFAGRNWSHKNLETLEKLAQAAQRLQADQAA